MSRKKEMFLVIDTETCNTIDQPLPYDIGYAICDRQGVIYEKRSFVVAEIFLDMKDVMQSAYYAKKIPQYWQDIKGGRRILKTYHNIHKQLLEDMKAYNVKKVGAYNMAFDKRALNNLTRYVTKSRFRWFFPFGTEFFCIWHMACQVLMDRVTFVKFAEKNNFVSQADNLQTSAEICYRYITNQIDFSESHTGLEDVEIEVQIMADCYRQHKKMNTAINTRCWTIPQLRKNKK